MDTFFFEDRAAHIASSQVPLIVALAGKNNLISGQLQRSLHITGTDKTLISPYRCKPRETQCFTQSQRKDVSDLPLDSCFNSGNFRVCYYSLRKLSVSALINCCFQTIGKFQSREGMDEMGSGRVGCLHSCSYTVPSSLEE